MARHESILEDGLAVADRLKKFLHKPFLYHFIQLKTVTDSDDVTQTFYFARLRRLAWYFRATHVVVLCRKVAENTFTFDEKAPKVWKCATLWDVARMLLQDGCHVVQAAVSEWSNNDDGSVTITGTKGGFHEIWPKNFRHPRVVRDEPDLPPDKPPAPRKRATGGLKIKPPSKGGHLIEPISCLCELYINC